MRYLIIQLDCSEISNFFMDVGVSKIKFVAEVGECPLIDIQFFFSGMERDLVHKAAAINSWFTNTGILKFKYDAKSDSIIISKAT